MEEITPENIQKAGMDKLLELYLKAGSTLEEIQASMSVIKDEMTARLDAENVKGKVVGDYQVTKVSRLVFKPTLEQARELVATKMVETIDTTILKRLHEGGAEIPGTVTTSYLMIKPVEKATE